MLNQNWLNVGCECVLYIFSLYVSKLALNMFSLWQIYYSIKYTFYMQIEASDLQIFVGFRGGLRPPDPPIRASPWTRPGGYRPPALPAPIWSHQMLASLLCVMIVAFLWMVQSSIFKYDHDLPSSIFDPTIRKILFMSLAAWVMV